MRTSEFGFDKAGDDTGPRMESLLSDMTEERLNAFRELAVCKSAYLKDARDTLAGQFRGRLQEAGIEPTPDLLDDMAMTGFDFIARAMAKFMLSVAEISEYGALQGDLPHPESERILSLDLDDLFSDDD